MILRATLLFLAAATACHGLDILPDTMRASMVGESDTFIINNTGDSLRIDTVLVRPISVPDTVFEFEFDLFTVDPMLAVMSYWMWTVYEPPSVSLERSMSIPPHSTTLASAALDWCTNCLLKRTEHAQIGDTMAVMVTLETDHGTDSVYVWSVQMTTKMREQPGCRHSAPDLSDMRLFDLRGRHLGHQPASDVSPSTRRGVYVVCGSSGRVQLADPW